MNLTNAHWRVIYLVAFIATIVLANWALEKWGIIDIGPGGWTLMAPAGVYFAGLSFGVRDGLHELGGRRWVLGAVAAGAVVSYLVNDGARIPGGEVSIAVASGIAFAVSEIADMLVYDPIRERQWPLAVAASNIVGAVIDSLLFLWLAFGTVDNFEGQVIGKTAMVLVALPLVAWARARRRGVPVFGW